MPPVRNTRSSFTLLMFAVFFAVFSFCEEPTFDVPTPSTSSYLVLTTVEAVELNLADVGSLLVDNLTASYISDITGSGSTLIGEADYSITNILIQNVDYDSVGVTTNPDDSSIAVEVEGGVLSLSFDYSVQLLSWPYTDEEGTGRVSIDDTTGRLNIVFPYDAETGAMSYDVANDVFNINSMEVEFQGGVVAAIANFIVDIFDEYLPSMVSSLFESSVLYYVDYFGETNLFDSVSCMKDLCLDARLGQAPTVRDTYIFNLYGGTYYPNGAADAYEAPGGFTVLPAPVNDKMVQVLFGPPSFTTYFRSLFDAGLFADVRGSAASSDFTSILPDLAAALAAQDVSYTFALAAAPSAEIFYSAVRVDLSLTLSFAAAGADAAVLTVALALAASGDVDFDGHHGDPSPYTGNMFDLSIELAPYDVAADVIESQIGDVALTDAFLCWCEDEFFSAVYDAEWAGVLEKQPFQEFNLNMLPVVDRLILYDPDYVALTYDLS
eukprot:gnl/Chilomastix_cuspidata/394.p1 GENE.gnl/Chilomastix_cuspidata/394~~gnl/Chilomastix_cuspidata/394.p1  ORF type:complete len:494 (+),score=186.16 gnl/Chilomastix_cuspidata/394:128-1609(+)